MAEHLIVQTTAARLDVLEAPDETEIPLDSLFYPSGTANAVRVIGDTIWIGEPNAVGYRIVSFDLLNMTFQCKKVDA